jgi:MinD-like ATPase involved in chromosome partitioning or flagellar assembly
LALANAAVYLARLGFRVAAIDFDLEAPGLHYKFSTNPDGIPLAVNKGVVDFVNAFMCEGSVTTPFSEFTVTVNVPGSGERLLTLIPAGQVPSAEYWSKLSRIDWHNLFYSKGAHGVQIFLELKARILDELRPDFLLVDSRTGITEMGGIATTLFADKVICLLSPTLENVEGARAVLRSLKRSRRESDLPDLEILVAVSRLPRMKGVDEEQTLTEKILRIVNEDASDLRDSLSCDTVFILHSEAALQIQEAIRVGSRTDPDESILLRDYLRLFATFVPKETIEPKVRNLIEKAKEKIWADPDAAVKEIEELAESFGHPEIYRELLLFYKVRNVTGTAVLKRGQRLWEMTGHSNDEVLWNAVTQNFEPQARWTRQNKWLPNLDFVKAVWRDAGNRNIEFAMKIATAYDYEDRESQAADVLLEIIDHADPVPTVVSRCIRFLDVARRFKDADALIQRVKHKMPPDPGFVEAWATHALKDGNKSALAELNQPPWSEALQLISGGTQAMVFYELGMKEHAMEVAESAMRHLDWDTPDYGTRQALADIALFYKNIGRWNVFEDIAEDGVPRGVLEEVRERAGMQNRRR